METGVEVGVAKRKRGNGSGRNGGTKNGGNGGPPAANGGTRRRTLREIIEAVERRVITIEDGVTHLRGRVEAIENRLDGHESRLIRLETGN